MIRNSVIPKDRDEWLKLRSRDVTSTEVAALFGASPYATSFELYHRHLSNQIVEIEGNERVRWGSRLQDAISEGIAEDQGWIVSKMEEYISLPEHRLGASFDFRIVIGDRESLEDGLLEIKNVDALMFRDGWIVGEDGELEAPLHIELQLQAQMLASGLRWGYIGALVGGNEVKLIKRNADYPVHQAIMNKARAFWERVNSGLAPLPEFDKDADFIRELYSTTQPGLTLTADDDIETLAKEYQFQSEIIKEATTKKEAARAQMLMAIGEAERVKGNGFSISAGVVEGNTVESYFRKTYRTFRINWSKPK